MKYYGPTSAREWGQLHSQVITGGFPGWWRLRGNQLYVYPAPTAAQTLAIPYQSANWCQSAALVGQTKWVADTDTALIPERLFTLGIVWRYKKAKGIDYAEDMSTYEREVERACSRDRGNNVLRLRRQNIDTFFPPTWPGIVVP